MPTSFKIQIEIEITFWFEQNLQLVNFVFHLSLFKYLDLNENWGITKKEMQAG
jgi:hypothetical protein